MKNSKMPSQATLDSWSQSMNAWSKAVTSASGDTRNVKDKPYEPGVCDCGGLKTYQSTDELYHSDWCKLIRDKIQSD